MKNRLQSKNAHCFFSMVLASILAKKRGIFIQKESETLLFSSFEIPQDFILVEEEEG
jgi:hypothetical protein